MGDIDSRFRKSPVVPCRHCNHDNGPERFYCNNCGSKLDRSLLTKQRESVSQDAPLVCAACHFENDYRRVYCNNCGTKLDRSKSARLTRQPPAVSPAAPAAPAMAPQIPRPAQAVVHTRRDEHSEIEPTAAGGARVFVSHSTRDRFFVESEIVHPLKSIGVIPWYSKIDLITGVVWERRIREGLRACQWFLVVITPDSISSEWVQAEVHWALANRPEHIVPVLAATCDPTDLHLKLARIQYIDYRRDIAEARARLLGMWR